MNKEINVKDFEEKYKNNYLSESAYSNLMNKNYELDEIKDIGQDKKISIIIPTYKRANILKQCIDSILKQTYKNFEIIIVDDCSPDETKEVVYNFNDPRIKYNVNEKNSGVGFNRQKGYKISTGDYVIFCDDDDYFIDNNYFCDLVNIFNDNSINVVCSNSYTHYESEDLYEFNNLNVPKQIESIKYLENFQIKYKKPNSTFTAVFRRSVLEKADFESMKMMNDSSIYLRALMIGGKTYINEKIIGIYRVHGKNITANPQADFIIENFEEKKYIYDYVKKNNLISNSKKWYSKQIGITARYFFDAKLKPKKETNKLLKWIRKNVSFSCFIKYKIFYILKKIGVK